MLVQWEMILYSSMKEMVSDREREGRMDGGITESVGTLYGMRQQTGKEDDQPCYAMGDFVAPLKDGKISLNIPSIHSFI